MFGRNKKSDEQAVAGGQDEVEDSTTQSAAELEATTDSGDADGPTSGLESDDLGNRVDLGALRVKPVAGMELRLELDSQREVTAAVIAIGEGLVQVQAFAAPRSSGIWDEIRGEIDTMITGNGGTVDRADGPFGPELRTRLPQVDQQGRTTFSPVVFAGIDGPRWMVRAVYSGTAAVDETTRQALDEAIRGLVVVRGEDPRAPREMLPLTMPDVAKPAGPGATGETDADTANDAGGTPSSDDLRPFERGPEITEVR